MKTILYCLLVMLLPLAATAEVPPYTPASENLANRAWFQNAKFGLFVHWGVYSAPGVEEWVMQKHEIDKPTYAKVRAAGYNSNFLLNLDPMPNGKIQPEFVKTLGIVGDWTGRYGGSIYGTRGGPVPPQSRGVTTHKDKRVFVHVLDWQQDSLLIPELGRPIEQVRSFPDGLALDRETTEFGTLLRLPSAAEGPDRIVEITWARER